MKKSLLTVGICMLAVTSFSQKDKGKKVESKYLSLPSYNITETDPSTVSVEFAMQDGSFGTEKLKDAKSKCVPKGGSLKDVVEVTSYYYEIPYTQGESYVIAKSADGNVVYGNKTSETGQSTLRFGWDEKMSQPQCEYFISDKLKKDWASQGNSFKSKEDSKYANSVFNEASQEAMANVYLSYMPEEFEVFTGKGKAYDYTDLDNALEKAVAAYEAIAKNGFNAHDLERLKECIAVWEKELESKDLEDKKARISEDIAKGLHENCARAYLYLYDFENAKEHAKEFQELFGNFSNNRSQAFDKVMIRIQLQKIAAGKNEAIMDNISKLHEMASSAKTSPAKRLPSSEFERVRSDYYSYVGSQANAVYEEKKKEEEEAIASGELNPYEKYYQPTMVGGEGFLMNMPPSALSGFPELTELPKEMCEFTDAKQIIILKNNIETIHPDIAKLENLKKLDLSGNKLKTLPPEIGNLINLETLKLSDNPLESLPDELANCLSLKTIVIKDTSLSSDQIKKLEGWFPDAKIKY